MNLTTKQKGDLTELNCITACYKKGWQVSIPWGENTRYDFILDIDNHLLKVQCKTCREVQEGRAIEFNCASNRQNLSKTFRQSYTKNDIDLFATFYQDNCYFIPVEHCGKTSKTIRITKPLNNISHNISFLIDYHIDNFDVNTYGNEV